MKAYILIESFQFFLGVAVGLVDIGLLQFAALLVHVLELHIEALVRAGFSGMALSWASPGNWKIQKR